MVFFFVIGIFPQTFSVETMNNAIYPNVKLPNTHAYMGRIMGIVEYIAMVVYAFFPSPDGVFANFVS